jgi:hypothetical protein
LLGKNQQGVRNNPGRNGDAAVDAKLVVEWIDSYADLEKHFGGAKGFPATR